MSTAGDITVGFLGVPGSYSHQAAEEIYGAAGAIGFRSFADVVRSVESGEITHGVVAVENSNAGRVDEVYQLLASMELSIIGEHFVTVSHCLAAAPGAGGGGAAGLRRVVSHKQALMQCRDWLRANAPQAEQVEAADTASAARDIAAAAEAGVAAICSERAAEIYGLETLARGIQDHDTNVTRFHLLARAPLAEPEIGPQAITTVVFQISHKPGALLNALTAISRHGVDMIKLETYMVSGNRAEPTFYVDIAVDRFSARGEAALSELSDSTSFLKVIGCYPASPMRGRVPGFLPIS